MTPGDSGIDRAVTSYGDAGFGRFLRGVFLASAGYDEDDLARPLVGIANLASDYNPCHRAVPEIIDHVRRGVLQSGGLPMVFPTMSLGETFLNPTSMIYRNLLAMETEELIRAQPMDAVVLLGGCDKTLPAQLMAAASSTVPVVIEATGPMLASTWQGERVGACTDCRRLWARHRSGELDDDRIASAQRALATTSGTCMVMGTASTMACLAETLGMMLPGGATAPSATGDRLRHAVWSGRRAVELAREPILPRDVLTPAAFRNAIRVLAASGGSTNAIIHLTAIMRRAGVASGLDDFEEVFRRIPLLLDLRPTGTGFLEDLHRAGGLRTLLVELRDVLELDHVGVVGTRLGDVLAGPSAPAVAASVVRSLRDPLGPPGSLAVLGGTLAPDGAVIKAAAASLSLLRHTGPAVVFDSPEDVSQRIDAPDLKVSAESVLVLRNAGPVAAGMPEAGSFPIPRRLAERGVTDMVRISDARMSGTSYGTVVLHCSPESAVGGPLSLVRDGDLIRLDVPERRVDLLVDEHVLAQRRTTTAVAAVPERGWRRLYARTVRQAHEGADLDFM